MSPERVFTKFALQTIDAVTELQARLKASSLEMSSHYREVRRAKILISCAGRHNQFMKLASWVSDWTINLIARPLIFGLRKRFASGNYELGVFDWQPDFGLLLCGKLDIGGKADFLKHGDDSPRGIKLPPLQAMSCGKLKGMVIVVPSLTKS